MTDGESDAIAVIVEKMTERHNVMMDAVINAFMPLISTLAEYPAIAVLRDEPAPSLVDAKPKTTRCHNCDHVRAEHTEKEHGCAYQMAASRGGIVLCSCNVRSTDVTYFS